MGSAVVKLYLPGGAEAVAETRSLQDGYYILTNVRPAFYDLVVEVQGKRRETIRNVKIDPARETQISAVQMRPGEFGQTAAVAQQQQTTAPEPIAAIQVSDSFQLGLGSSASLLEIADEQQGAEVDSNEIASTMRPEEVRGLPVLERDPVELLRTRAGMNLIGVHGNGIPAQLITVVNGQRSSYASMTLDGINIQGHLIRINTLGSEFNRLFLDQLSEFTVITSNHNSALAGGTAQVVMATPSGTNQAHGSLYWYHRNNRLTANNWVDNARGFTLPGFSQNQYGASGQGPIRKDKLLFFGNYEGFRRKRRDQVTRYLPSADIRRGIFTYYDPNLQVRKIDLLGLTGATIHPDIQKLLASLPPASAINNRIFGDSITGDIINTSGYQFPLRNNLDRDSVLLRVDGIQSTKHAWSAVFNHTRDSRDDPGRYTTGYSKIPTTSNDSPRTFYSGFWRWNPTSQFTNEVRFGLNKMAVILPTSETFGDRQLAVPDYTDFAIPLFSNPVNPYLGERRDETLASLQSNASWTRGRHSLQFGFQSQWIKGTLTNSDSSLPVFHVGTAYGPFTSSNLPSVFSSTADNANLWLSFLSGEVDAVDSSYYQNSSGGNYTNKVPWVRHYRYPLMSGYLMDTWRAAPRLTVIAGLRYDFYKPVNEKNSLAAAPLSQNITSDFQMSAAGNSVGRPWYNSDKNNFGPNIGISWDTFGNRSAVIRAGYSIYYVNDEHIRAAAGTLDVNPGTILNYSRYLGGTALLTNAQPTPVPTLKLPFLASAYANQTDSLVTNIGLINPDLRTPYVQEWNFGIQHEMRGGFLAEIRYVGNHSTKGLRQLDLNQVNINAPGYLQDFKTALNNGRIIQNQFGVFDPRYYPQIAGTQPLPYFATLPFNGGLDVSDPYLQYLIFETIRRGEAGELGLFYGRAGFGSPPFVPNRRYGAGVMMLGNSANSSYNGLQLELRRRLRAGWQMDANYVFSKSLGDSPGLNSQRFDTLLDNNNPGVERSRTPFDIRHAIKVAGIWAPPISKLAGSSRFSRKAAQGWTLSAIMISQSGNPFSILSGRGTFNTSGSLNSSLSARSTNNPASSPLTYQQLKDIVRFHYEPVGFSVINPSATLTGVSSGSYLGRGAREVGDPTFAGQVFFNPQPGTIGNLAPRMFSGPWQYNIDMALVKSTPITDRQNIEFRVEVRNLLNHPNFFIFDQNINEPVFGHRGASTGNGERQIQLGLYYRF